MDINYSMHGLFSFYDMMALLHNYCCAKLYCGRGFSAFALVVASPVSRAGYPHWGSLKCSSSLATPKKGVRGSCRCKHGGPVYTNTTSSYAALCTWWPGTAVCVVDRGIIRVASPCMLHIVNMPCLKVGAQY